MSLVVSSLPNTSHYNSLRFMTARHSFIMPRCSKWLTIHDWYCAISPDSWGIFVWTDRTLFCISRIDPPLGAVIFTVNSCDSHSGYTEFDWISGGAVLSLRGWWSKLKMIGYAKCPCSVSILVMIPNNSLIQNECKCTMNWPKSPRRILWFLDHFCFWFALYIIRGYTNLKLFTNRFFADATWMLQCVHGM